MEGDVKKVFLADDVYGRKCADHDPLLHWIRTDYENRQALKYQARRIQRHYHMDGLVLRRNANGIPWVGVLDYKGRQRRSYQLLLLLQSSNHPTPTIDVQTSTIWSAIDPGWVDFSVAKRWLKKCITQHTSGCQSSSNIRHVSPAWLIDTTSHCLVSGEGITDFVALSYRWGPSTHRFMNSVIFKELTISGGLTKHSGLITPTVNDAMQAVRAIGEQYLWVDALCLAPDDDRKLSEQLQLMGSIYSSAKLTIVALDGDAMDGLPGTGVLPRNLQNTFDWKDSTKILARHLPSLSALEVDASEYFQRGWTFQEYNLSRRRLIFANQQIHWRCSCALWHEDCPDLEDNDRSFLVTKTPNIEAGWPDLRELGNLITEYNNREFSFEEDAFPGITGLLAHIGNAFKAGFLFGLPKQNFDAALMWGCSLGRDSLNGAQFDGVRRRISSGRTGSVLPNAVLPSWSWIGWKGYPIDIFRGETQYLINELSIGESETGYIGSFKGDITVPITQWFSQKSPDASDKDIVTPCLESDTIISSTTVTDFDSDVWRCIRYVPSEHGADSGRTILLPWRVSGEYVYEHIHFPGVFRWFPLPYCSPKATIESQNTLEHPYISCKTERVWLAAVTSYRFLLPIPFDAHLGLYDKLGRICGWLQLPNDDEVSGFERAELPGDIDSQIVPSATKGIILNQFPADEDLIELVAICLRKSPEIDYKTKTVNYDDSYGVLWVKWVDGVAYRYGCGYVTKDMWHEQNPQTVDLVLG